MNTLHVCTKPVKTIIGLTINVSHKLIKNQIGNYVKVFINIFNK